MILDYNYSKSKRIFSISYVTETGGKSVMNFNVDKFKSFYSTPTGQYENWDGSKCDIKWIDNPTNFDLRTFITEMPQVHKAKLNGKIAPRLYTFDIETEISDEFPDPAEAKFPITTISITSPDYNVIVLGTKELEHTDSLQNHLNEYLKSSKYFNSLNVKLPYIKYMKFDKEDDMLDYFLRHIVAKVPVLAGWNSIMFDWQYIQNRIRNYFPNLSISISSYNGNMMYKNYADMKGNKVKLQMPCHTLILDMMDVIGNFDMVVMPIKESLSLDYISSESIGMNKIKYDGSLQDLFERDYERYVFYNAVDSILVQLIDKRFKTLQNIYTQALYCKEKIGSCFSKIALTEALFFNYFYENGIKIVPTRQEDVHRGTLVGAYVRTPTPGKHNFVCCNDFASLYPSSIITCNMSIENFAGVYWDEYKLNEYRNDNKYIVVGPNVYLNKGTLKNPEIGEHIGKFLDEDKLNKYRNNKNYFVSVNGSLYRNDKNYAFKEIQATLKSNRNIGKYLAKQLEALVISDIDHILGGQQVKNQIYPDNIVKCISDLGFDVKSTDNLYNLTSQSSLQSFRDLIKKEIEYNTSFEQAMKLLGNSMYGGSSHVAFFWFNMHLANDITGEARNIIHKMEAHIPKLFENEWFNMKELHKKLGITLKSEYCQL